jgi:hypothetical protein
MTDPTAERDAALAATPLPQRAELAALDQAIRAAAPSLDATVDRGFFGYGRYRYRYASGREGAWYCLSLVARKAGLSLYVGATGVEQWADRLPKASCGKGCIRVVRADDIDAAVLGEIVQHAVAIDGKLLDWTGRDQAGEPRIA